MIFSIKIIKGDLTGCGNIIKRVIQLMCNPGSQGANGREFFGLDELILTQLQLVNHRIKGFHNLLHFIAGI